MTVDLEANIKDARPAWTDGDRFDDRRQEHLADQCFAEMQVARVEARIALLKRIRQQTIELGALTQTFSLELFDAYSAPRAKIDSVLATLLLERELAVDQLAARGYRCLP